ncbi:patatin-like phospholipase family protein [Homoserinibacter sp. GY 40078]|uniref:patatin-like phospholipase family protein n=1 Tax=Homoserinibacter sp. GY 40078 TaxID=2603275 RepID=UPI00164F0B9A|nr:patatin-like phospholipase family protein [Homoserinibacter sp. GY 40078]
MSTTTEPTSAGDRWASPELECDLVMKGGIASAVVYPRAIAEFATRYRLRSVGGTSAGAIGAAFAAAAEYGRSSAVGGFGALSGLPDELGDGRLAELFRPQKTTAVLLPFMLIATGHDRPGPARSGASRVGAIAAHLIRGLPLGLLGGLPGALLVALGIIAATTTPGWGIAAGIALIVVGLFLGVLGWLVASGALVMRVLTGALPENGFGICTGLGTDSSPAFTDWLSSRIDHVAGLEPGVAPLTFGQLRSGPAGGSANAWAPIDLRMVTTCLTRARPYEMPWEANTFSYDPDEWARIFPAYVMRALADHVPVGATEEARWIDRFGASGRAGRRLLRLPAQEDLPVIVATRLSLSYPLLISAVPLWAVDYRSTATRAAIDALRVGDEGAADAAGIAFERLWFTDGGLCNNFPLQFFDRALPTRPTFAIDLGDARKHPGIDDELYRYARDNREGMEPPHVPIPENGFGALASFARAIFTTPQGWADNAHLDVPGYRDRVIKILQTPEEGGLNLHMKGETIAALADRSENAARALMEQFARPRYRVGRTQSPTGWDNHRWVRFRALLAVLPDFLDGFRTGREALDIDPANPPSYSFETAQQLVGGMAIADGMRDAASARSAVPEEVIRELKRTPPRAGVLRRSPQL